MNIANRLTILRIVLAFMSMWFALSDEPSYLIAAFIFFIVASITDFFDGYYARKLNIISDLGKILDPIADKILVIGLFTVFVYKGLVSPWALILIVARELWITGMRMFALRRGQVLAAKSFGKQKTVSQMIAIIVIFLFIIIQRYQPPWPWFKPFMSGTIFLVILWVVTITVLSGIMYWWENRKIIRSL
jgi:CDP-diacylglycerol--glycerol-3-phosphate 3-phosphatidyltransferase